MNRMITIGSSSRKILAGLFSNYRHFRFMISAVLEGRFGSALADNENKPRV